MSAWKEPGPAPPVFTTAVAGVMRRTGRRDTRPELALGRELHRRGLRYLVDTTPPGTNRRRRADLVFRGARVAVFVDGCFRHSCPLHLHRPQANADWWRVKLASITARDRDTDAALAAAGWHVVRVWEHEDPRAAADRVHGVVHARRRKRPRRPRAVPTLAVPSPREAAVVSPSRPVLRTAAALLVVAGATACGTDAPAATPAPATTASATTASWTETHLTGTDRTLTWDVVVPRSTGSPVADELNRRITASAEDVIEDARASVQDGDPPRAITGRGTVTTDDGRTAQVLLEVIDGTEGAAHPTTTLASTVVDVRTGRPVTLDDVFTDPATALADLGPVVEGIAEAQGEPVTDPSGLAPEEGNWATWQSGPEGLAFSFQDFQLGGHGVRRYVVPWEGVEPLMTARARELLAPR